VTAAVETTAPSRAQVMRESAAALADTGLTRAVEAFLAANAAWQEAWSNLTRAQASGPDPVPANTEFLHDEAQHYWDVLATGWAENLLPKQVREAGAEYARPKIVHTPVVQSGPCDWSRGR
jgi:hypothetical protein